MNSTNKYCYKTDMQYAKKKKLNKSDDDKDKYISKKEGTFYGNESQIIRG